MPVPDDIYKNDVDFTTLALQYPDFAKKLKPNRQLDFSDPESVRQLTMSLLHRDFDLTVDLPEDRLCPPVPNRFNYILFIQRLLDSTSPDFHDGFDPGRQVIGLDIGTGSSAIYPLLACRQRERWLFLATEIDEKNRTSALKNIAANNLQSRIKLIDTDPKGKKLIPSAELERFNHIDILMTNPPFYTSQASMSESSSSKSRPPNSSCTGAPIEMITPGGEVAFVSRLVLESVHPFLKTRIQWFSAMLGKLSSVAMIVERLREKGCENHAVAEFVQGQKTRRWCVAWSWMGLRPKNAVARQVGTGSGVEKRLLPPLTEATFDIDGQVEDIVPIMDTEMAKLDLMWKYTPSTRSGMLLSREGDVWSRKARRKKVFQQHEHQNQCPDQKTGKKEGDEGEDEEMKDSTPPPQPRRSNKQCDAVRDGSDPSSESDDGSEPAFVARISMSPSPTMAATSKRMGTGTRLHIRHLQGYDTVLFESFTGWLKRKISGRR
ncbi:uncharacterized protein Z518_07644 [Rhinocladiella mackenziei CBS 650.93]|uniref:U6 small nuclear RNA (adenine-(43)-N(6))-methyltransferase n=1 Tax=Rhinocladiella mackenziei CBS 650.93 TaxID=1442369 RepID=A0A0D2ILM5_9EURO|nr:uncharacterized protein Z518_07644 [Rhinocladiella mackenziei CBS 650.93]KIX04091.1 hypothetical protein Z518_07644 [Rhinocladiella mackenziei CBS 650.93]